MNRSCRWLWTATPLGAAGASVARAAETAVGSVALAEFTKFSYTTSLTPDLHSFDIHEEAPNSLFRELWTQDSVKKRTLLKLRTRACARSLP